MQGYIYHLQHIKSLLRGKYTQTNTIMTNTQAYITASKFYLCEPLPEDFDDLDEQDVTDFIRDNKWEPFEQWEPHGIWELIEDLASEFLTATRTAE